jgi:hypothetical protein
MGSRDTNNRLHTQFDDVRKPGKRSARSVKLTGHSDELNLAPHCPVSDRTLLHRMMFIESYK